MQGTARGLTRLQPHNNTFISLLQHSKAPGGHTLGGFVRGKTNFMFATLENLQIFQSCFFTGENAARNAALSQKAALQMLLPFTTPTREKGIQKRPQAFLNPELKIIFPLKMARAQRKPFQIVLRREHAMGFRSRSHRNGRSRAG